MSLGSVLRWFPEFSKVDRTVMSSSQSVFRRLSSRAIHAVNGDAWSFAG